MSIRVTCEKCGVVLKVKEELAGTKGKCPACKGTLHVPTLEQAAQAAPLAATETAPASAAGDTGALKVPSARPKAAKVATPPGDESAPPQDANGSSPKPSAAPAAEASNEPAAESPAPLAQPVEPPPPAPAAESPTDDATETPAPPPPAAKDKTSPKKKAKLRMSETDAEDEAPPATSKPAAENPVPEKPAAEKPATRKAAAEAESAETNSAPDAKAPAESKPAPAKGEKSTGDEFDLDSFLMEGPKPKAPPPVPEETPGRKGAAPPRGSGRKLSMSDDETNVSGPSETLPPPNRGRGGAAESAMAALTGGGGGTASSAKDLLARASQEGRNRASQMPDEDRERFDYVGAIKTIGRQFGPHIAGTIALCALLFFGMDYMLGSNVKLPPLGRTTGTVTLKKQPLAGVVVNFTPIAAKDTQNTSDFKGPMRTATAVTDANGKFELMYMDGIRGAVVGKNRVWIDPLSPENFKKIPGNYHKAETSGDVRDVKATSNEFNIDL